MASSVVGRLPAGALGAGRSAALSRLGQPAPRSALRALVAGSRAELAELLLRPWPWFADLCARDATYAEPQFCASAIEAARAWDAGLAAGRPYDLVFSVLEPGSTSSAALPDTSRRETGLASGLGLFGRIRSAGQAGAAARLVAIASRPQGWGADGVYAALARLLLGADVVDVTQRDSFGRPLVVPASFPPPAPSQADRPPGGLLTPPNPRRDGAGTAGTASSNQKQPWGYATRQPAAPFDETLDDAIWEASRDFDRRARAFADALTQLAAISYRGELSKTLGHPLQWLRTLAKVEYEPQLLSLVARACENADQPLPPSLRLLNLSLPSRVNLARSRHTLARYLGETFDIMSDLAGEWLAAFGGWARLTEAPPPRFWSLPVSKAARAFIDAAFPALVFEDVDAAWPPQGLA